MYNLKSGPSAILVGRSILNVSFNFIRLVSRNLIACEAVELYSIGTRLLSPAFVCTDSRSVSFLSCFGATNSIDHVVMSCNCSPCRTLSPDCSVSSSLSSSSIGVPDTATVELRILKANPRVLGSETTNPEPTTRNLPPPLSCEALGITECTVGCTVAASYVADLSPSSFAALLLSSG